MIIGVPKEIKNHEYRVGLTPHSVWELTKLGHKVFIETSAGKAIGFSDQDYIDAGAEIQKSAKETFDKSDMIVKVKEPQKEEYNLIHEGQILFTFLHLAPDPEQTQALIKSKCKAIAYETVTDRMGGLPLLAPMSEVAGRMSVQVGAHHLEKGQGGSGILLSGLPGVSPAKVAIIGGGVVGTNAARIAVGMGAEVTILDNNNKRLKELDWLFGTKAKTIFANSQSIANHVAKSDLVIGAVLVAGAAAPKLVTKDMIQRMREGSVIVDVAIDQGGCLETSQPTTHENPTYAIDGVVHYCVTNIPGAVARTSAIGLNNATLPFTLALAQKGFKKALFEDSYFKDGLNVCDGFVTNEPVAKALGHEFHAPEAFIQ